ncbi:MAG: methylmalonyl-CoA mutase, partial [Candidatus Marinimicrobia bacterium]|nr:methylmalonyl-CoA mutase [Candidatus Neomarinimicrobiota bacterium]
TNSRDEALMLPSEEAARVALRTQQIIANETGLPDYPDPFGGSYVIEEMTDNIEQEARAIIAEIDNLGGAVQAIEQGWIQNEIACSAYDYQRGVDDGTNIVIGVNKYIDDDQAEPATLKVNLAAVEQQKKHLDDFKKKRDNSIVSNQLSVLSQRAAGSENLLPTIIDCVRSRCTLGEIADNLRESFGEYKL